MSNLSALGRVWLDGRLVAAGSARVSAFDRGFLFGDGCYETLRAYGGKPFLLDGHIGRLFLSASRLGFRGMPSRSSFVRAVGAVLKANSLRSARVRLVVTRGEGWPEMGDPRTGQPTVLVYAFHYVPPSAAAMRDGVRIILAKTVRNDRRAADPAIKSICLLNALTARREADRAGAFEAVMANPQGYLAEAIAANIFFVRRGKLFTPALSAGILPGITRDLVIALARRSRIPVREGFFRPAELSAADEAFLTASTIEIVPVAMAGAKRLPSARPVTRRIQEAYWKEVGRVTGVKHG